MTNLSRSIGLLLLLALCACASTTERSLSDRVEVADAVLLRLPSTQELNQTLSATQILSGTYDTRSYTIQIELEWRRGSIALAALNSFGVLLFSMSYDGSVLETRSSSALMRGLRPEYVLADILMTYWEQPMLELHLESANVTVRDTALRRAIDRSGSPVITIDYETESRWEGEVHFVHRERGYELLIRTVNVEVT